MRRNIVKPWMVVVLAISLLICGGCGKKEVATEDKNGEKKEIEDLQEDLGEKLSDEEDASSSETEETAVTKKVKLEGMEELIGSVVDPLLNSGAVAAVYVEDLNTGAYASFQNETMQAASLIKLYIASCVYEHWELVNGQAYYEGETEDLLNKMITISDNEATNTLTLRLGSGDPETGMGTVNQFCQERGFSETHMGRLLLQPNATGDNLTSVKDCSSFLREIYEGNLPGSAEILELMKAQERTAKIPAGVPEGVITANKTGELTDVENDVAIIYGEEGTYSLCVMMSNLTDTYSARNTITQLSSEVYRFLCENES